MSDDVVIKDYADLINDSKLRGDDPDAVGLELQDLGGDTDHLVAWLPGWLVDSSSSGSRKPTAGRKASTRISRTGSRAREELRGVLEARKIGVAVGLAATDAAALSRLGLTVVSKRMGVEPINASAE